METTLNFKDDLVDKEVAEKLSKEVSSYIIEQLKNNMDNSIEERARLAVWQIFEEIGLSKHSVDRVSEIIAEKIIEQKAIDINMACEWFEGYLAEIGYPDDWCRDSEVQESGEKRFRKFMEE